MQRIAQQGQPEKNICSRRDITLFCLAFIITLSLSYIWLASNTRWLIPNVTTTELIGGCEMEIYYPPAQPVKTIALACPRTDLIRLWPFPPTQPWLEEELPTPTKNNPNAQND